MSTKEDTEALALFLQAMEGVDPLVDRPEAPTVPVPKKPRSPKFKESPFCIDGDEGRIYGVSDQLMARLRGCEFEPVKTLDLHGMRQETARSAIVSRIRDSHAMGVRCVIVIHGRGNNSPAGGVLRHLTHRTLTRGSAGQLVLAYCRARYQDGGDGATYVLLRKRPQS